MFSIVVVSWNNLPYLKLLVASILEHSSCPNHEIIVHVQEYCAQTIKWLETQGISYTGSSKNIGLAAAANMASENATREFICLIDDDMYVLPGWDHELMQFAELHGLEEFWLVSTMLERFGEYTVRADYGRSVEEFDRNKLLKGYRRYLHKSKSMINISALPGLIPTVLWREIGGYDEDFAVIGSEIGLARKLWDRGCKDIGITVPRSLVYHFQAASTGKLQNLEELQVERDNKFLRKYGCTLESFRDFELRKGQLWGGAKTQISPWARIRKKLFSD